MKHLKLFFALFAMLALGVGNAWGAEKITDYSKIVTGKTYYIGATTGGTDYYLSVSGASTSTSIAGTAKTDKANATAFVFTGSGTSWTIKFADYANYLGLKSSKDNGKVQVVSSAATFTASNQSEKLRLSIGSYSIQKNNSGTQFGSYGNTQTDIWLEEVPGSSEPTTQYTVKWYTAIGSSDDVKYDEGATITKPATDPTMNGYEFMGWTDQCSVAEDGTGFTALTNFGTADSDKEFYAVFAVATVTEGAGGGETGSVTMKYSGSTTTNMSSGNNAATVGLDANKWSVVPTQGSASNMPGLNKAGDIRLYGHASGGNYLTISSASYTITDITVTYTGDSYKNGKIYVGDNNVTASSGTTYNINASEFVIKNGNSSTTQVRIKTLVINYSTGGGSTTTYNNYITTCSGSTPVETLTDAQFAWSAATAEATMGASNTFPTLINTLPVSVTYESSTPATATIDATSGAITLVAPGTTTISAKFAGGEVSSTTYAAKTVTYALTVLKAPATPTSTVYVKVTSTAGITDGKYLIVYEDAEGNPKAPVAFDGSLETLDAVGNTLEVVINNNTIAGTNYIDAATFTIDVTNGTILSASGKYIGKTANSNGLDEKTTAMTNTFAFDANGNAVITGNTAALRYNKAADQKRFRYYKDGGGSQEKIALYKKASSHTLTYGTCTNGSVSADVADGATVLSGTTITLSNTPTTDYKLSAYDVYKTGDETTKVTVTNGKFIMPEFDVTISATFVPAKTLTSIEITSAATQTTFWQGETFNYTGLEVTAHFDGAADEVVTPTVTGSTATAGTQTVTVSFTEGTVTKTATYTITVEAIPNTQETAYTVADAFDIIDKLTTANGVFIKGIVSQVDEYLSSYKSITYWISDDGTTTKQLQAYSGKGLDGAEFSDINGVSKADQVIVCGNLKKHTDGTYEFNYNNYLVSQIKTTKADPELSYTTTEYNVNLGDAFTAPTLNNPHTLAVTYSSNNEDVATVGTDGAVTIKAAGTVTITASFAGDENYVAGEASYTINITDPSVSSVTFDAAVDIPTEGLTLTKNGISMEFTAGTMNNGEEYRCNASNTMTISYTDGFITKVVLNCLANGTTKYGPGCFTTTIGSYSYEEKVGTWTGEAKSVVFTSGQQVRMTTVTVYYKQDKRANSELAWSEATVSLTVGDAFTAPTLSNPNGLSGITFASSNEELATVNNAGAITLVSGKTGTATITATYAGNETYKPAEVKCTISVNPKTNKVVILAEYNGQWYALKNAEETAGKVLAALPVNYVGGKLYNVADADKATIEWQLAIDGTVATFKNGENYIFGTAGSTDLKLSTTECAWTLDGSTYKIGNRTFLYRAQANGFKNYNAEDNAGTADYSSLPVVTAPVYATGDAYSRSTTAGKFGTICLPFGSTNFTGAEFFECVGKEEGKVYLGSVTTLVAGVPYIFEASAAEVAVYGDGTTAATPSNSNGLHGTFTDDTEVAANDDNHILLNNELRKVAETCWVNAYRAYIVMSEVPTEPVQQMPGRRYIGMSVQGENEATGFENITAPEGKTVKAIVNGQLIIIRDGEMYNAQGVRL